MGQKFLEDFGLGFHLILRLYRINLFCQEIIFRTFRFSRNSGLPLPPGEFTKSTFRKNRGGSGGPTPQLIVDKVVEEGTVGVADLTQCMRHKQIIFKKPF